MRKNQQKYPQALDRALRQAAEIIMAADGRLVCLTGAGISVDSGISAFRGSQGLWDKYDPSEYAEISSFRLYPEKIWTMLGEMLTTVEQAQPNQVHKSLVEMEERGWLDRIITQNVDGLHQVAGSRRVIEFHGGIRDLVCLECAWRWPQFTLAEAASLPPRCRQCETILKPDVV